MATKLPLIVWSGGVDSTANVIMAFSNEIPFETVYVKLPNNDKEQKQELLARKRIIKKLTALYGNYHIKDTEVNFVGVLPAKDRFAQPYIWATSVAWNVDFDKYTKLVFGYIKGDDFWHVKNEFETVLRASHKLLLQPGNVPPIEYPLEWLTKPYIMRDFYRNLPEVLKLTYTCSGGKPKPCGKCEKCEQFNKAQEEAKEIQ